MHAKGKDSAHVVMEFWLYCTGFNRFSFIFRATFPFCVMVATTVVSSSDGGDPQNYPNYLVSCYYFSLHAPVVAISLVKWWSKHVVGCEKSQLVNKDLKFDLKTFEFQWSFNTLCAFNAMTENKFVVKTCFPKCYLIWMLKRFYRSHDKRLCIMASQTWNVHKNAPYFTPHYATFFDHVVMLRCRKCYSVLRMQANGRHGGDNHDDDDDDDDDDVMMMTQKNLRKLAPEKMRT